MPPLSSAPIILVTMDDGTVFSCTPQPTAGPGAGQARWKIVDAAGRAHAGPVYLGFTSQTDLRRLICEWWDANKGRGEATRD